MPETCRRPLLWIGVGLRRSKQYLTRLAPESWKSESAQIVSQTIDLDSGESQEVKTRLNSNPGSLRVLRACRRPLIWNEEGPRSSKQGLTRLAP